MVEAGGCKAEDTRGRQFVLGLRILKLPCLSHDAHVLSDTFASRQKHLSAFHRIAGIPLGVAFIGTDTVYICSSGDVTGGGSCWAKTRTRNRQAVSTKLCVKRQRDGGSVPRLGKLFGER